MPDKSEWFLSPLPAGVAFILDTLVRHGFDAYAVGGCVRDFLRGETPADWDVATAASPAEVTALFGRVIPTGAAFGTVTVCAGSLAVEVTTFRAEADYTDHRRPGEVTFGVPLEDDLSRRDFTVNAMAYRPDTGVIDPFGGQADLAARVLRCVGDPAARFEEDALRILRGVRFAAVLDFDVEPATAAAMNERAGDLKTVAPERIYNELKKAVCGAAFPRVAEQFAAVLEAVLPRQYTLPVAPSVSLQREENTLSRFKKNAEQDCEESRVPGSTVAPSADTLAILRRSPPYPIPRFAALLWDVQEADALSALDALRPDRATRRGVAALLAVRGGSPAQRLVRLGEQQAHWLCAMTGQPGALDKLPGFAHCRTRSALAVRGDELQALGVPAARIGDTLDALWEAVLEGRLDNEAESLMEYINKNSDAPK